MSESGDERGELQLGGVHSAAPGVDGLEGILVGQETFGVVAAQVGRAQEVRGTETAADLKVRYSQSCKWLCCCV